MAEDRERWVTGPAAELAEQVRARVAAADQQVQQTRQRVMQAMAQVRRVDRRLRPAAADDPEGGDRVDHVTEVMRRELAAHLRAVELHGAAAELQAERGWPARAAVARAYAAQARERSRRAREELARHQARVAAAKGRG